MALLVKDLVDRARHHATGQECHKARDHDGRCLPAQAQPVADDDGTGQDDAALRRTELYGESMRVEGDMQANGDGEEDHRADLNAVSHRQQIADDQRGQRWLHDAHARVR